MVVEFVCAVLRGWLYAVAVEQREEGMEGGTEGRRDGGACQYERVVSATSRSRMTEALGVYRDRKHTPIHVRCNTHTQNNSTHEHACTRTRTYALARAVSCYIVACRVVRVRVDGSDFSRTPRARHDAGNIATARTAP